MLLHDIYYLIKPFIPRRLQLEIRRRVIFYKRSKYSDVWPINEHAGKPPERWPGWPEGKKFALVLTHDVETAEGQERCIQLAMLEERLGFRSSFNFVAEGYPVSAELRGYLKKRGFEVGVHGLIHNGNPFRSKEVFQKQAAKINEYLKEWESSGFRSPCMYHNLDWIGELNIDYDASTFDTDPFEPQPDGLGTIFPFWVPRNSSPCSLLLAPCSTSSGVQPSSSSSNLDPLTFDLSPSSSNLKPHTALANGYVELPYTLPQDFTLYILMKERNINIWKKKLDWIAECRGMALLCTHPDYMNLDGNQLRVEEYPADYYREFLQYVKHKYKGQFWQLLPKDLARFCKQNEMNRENQNSIH
jgi:hypothetical protein